MDANGHVQLKFRSTVSATLLEETESNERVNDPRYAASAKIDYQAVRGVVTLVKD